MGDDYYNEDNNAEKGYKAPPKQGSTGKVLLIILAIGAILSCICLFGGATLLVPALLSAKEKAMKQRSANNLRQISLAAIIYSDDKRAFPHSPNDNGLGAFKALYKSKYVDDPSVFVDPETNIMSIDELNESNVGYEGFLIPMNNRASSRSILAWEREDLFLDGRNVAFADGSVRFVSEEEFQSLIARMNKRIKVKKE